MCEVLGLGLYGVICVRLCVSCVCQYVGCCCMHGCMLLAEGLWLGVRLGMRLLGQVVGLAARVVLGL